VGMNDILLTSFTNPAAQILEPTFQKSPTMTIYFNMANALLQIFIITWVTIKFIEPRFPVNEEHFKDIANTEIGDLEKKGVKYASISFLLFIALIVGLSIGPNAFLKDENGSLVSVSSPLMGGLIFFMSVAFLIPGFIYGKVTKKIKT
ncbi:AbgT family transporter, partial [Fusobacterium polymorphum]